MSSDSQNPDNSEDLEDSGYPENKGSASSEMEQIFAKQREQAESDSTSSTNEGSSNENNWPQYSFQAPTPILMPNAEEDDAPVDSGKRTADPEASASAQESRQSVDVPKATESNSAATKSASPSQPTQGSQAAQGNDDQLIQQTKIQIRNLVNEIQQLALSDCTVEDFYEGFLSRVTSALASVGGAIWKVNDQGRLELQFQINVGATELADNEQAQISHDLLLRKLIQNNEPALVQPRSGSGDSEDASNPTSCLLVVERLMVDQKIVGLVEVFQRSGSGPTTQRGYLRFLVQMCEIASDFLKNKKIRNYQQQQELWEKLEHFIRSSHYSLDPKQTAYTVANEGRRLVDCDRVSFAKKEGGQFRIEVVSGLDAIDRRADEIKKLGELATAVVKGEKPLWYNGNTEDLPPQIEQRIQAYVDRSHSKVVCVIPLWETQKEDIVEEPETISDKAPPKDVLGALVFERLGDSRIENSFRKRIEIVSAHASDALTNSIRHHNVFLMPLWQAIGRTRIFSRAAMPRWGVFLSIFAVILGILCLLPWDFELSAEGKLTPEVRHEIYSPADGEILNVISGAEGEKLVVKDQQILAQLNNDDLRRELIEVQNNIVLEVKKINEFEEQMQSHGEEMTYVQQLRVKTDQAMAMARIQGLRIEESVIKDKINSLTVKSPGKGMVVDWQLDEKLKNRQVSRGQKLMTIVDESEEWIIEVEMMEKKFGHLVRAQENFDTQNLEVTFVLVSLPNLKYKGRLISVDRKADVTGEKGNTILLRIAFDKEDIDKDLLLYGTKVTTRIHCGKRSLGYVLFREVYETLQRNVFFWF